jgi:hypothetical protein
MYPISVTLIVVFMLQGKDVGVALGVLVGVGVILVGVILGVGDGDKPGVKVGVGVGKGVEPVQPLNESTQYVNPVESND